MRTRGCQCVVQILPCLPKVEKTCRWRFLRAPTHIHLAVFYPSRKSSLQAHLIHVYQSTVAALQLPWRLLLTLRDCQVCRCWLGAFTILDFHFSTATIRPSHPRVSFEPSPPLKSNRNHEQYQTWPPLLSSSTGEMVRRPQSSVATSTS
jgi:hypothetical protein